MSSNGPIGLREIDLGGFDAESDPELEDYFLETEHARSLFDKRQRIFLGRKGSGKSSLFLQLPRLSQQYKRKDFVIHLTPDSYAWDAMKSYRENGVSSELAHTNAWRFTLVLEAGLYLTRQVRHWSPESQKNLHKFKQFVGSNFGADTSGNLQATSGVLKSLDSFNLSAFGFGVGLSTHEHQHTRLTPDITDQMLRALQPALQEAPVLIALDKLDDAWDGSPEARSLLIGLLKAAKELNDEHKGRRHEDATFGVVTFLRSDIYSSLNFDDKDKHRALEHHLTWDETTLRDVVSRRLPEGILVDDLFEIGNMRGGVLPFDHILKRTFFRPREVLQFVNHCIFVALSHDRDAVQISKENVRTAESQFSSWKVEDLKQEYEKSEPALPALLEALRQKVHRYDHMDELVDLLREREPAVVAELGDRRALEVLFNASAIGIRSGNTGATRYKSTSPEISLPNVGSVYVHQGLYGGLNITERRERATHQEGG